MGADEFGFVLRRFDSDDLIGVVDLLNLSEQEVIGQDYTSPVRFSADMKASKDLYPFIDTAVILADHRKPVAYAQVYSEKVPPVRFRAYGKVHPDFRQKGIGTRLVRWSEEQCLNKLTTTPSEMRVVLHHSVYASETDAVKLLLANGYQHVRSSFRMLINLDEINPQPKIPEGITIRPIEDSEADLRAAARVDQQAFLDHWGTVGEPFEEYYGRFRQRYEKNPKYCLSASRLAVAGECPIGLAICKLTTEEDLDKGWVNILGVLKSWRKCGVGMALLEEEFAEFKRWGKKKAGLYVDAQNHTGAVQLYQRAGMHVELERQVFEKELRPGVDLLVHF